MCSPPVFFIFSVFTVSVLSSKFLHLFNHFSTVPLLSFIFFLPTFFVYDFLVICFERLLLQQGRGPVAIIGSIIGGIIALVALGGASSQLGFYVKTGGELEWRDATSYATNKEGLKVLLTGSWSVIASGCVLLVIAFFLRAPLYNVVGAFLSTVWDGLVFVWRLLASKVNLPSLPGMARFRGRYHTLEDADESDSESAYDLADPHDSEFGNAREPSGSASSTLLPGGTEKASMGREHPSCSNKRILVWVLKLVVAAFVTVAMVVRPDKPYDFISITLPAAMLQVFGEEPDFCAEQRRLLVNPWPFPDLLDKKFWHEADGNYKGWAPTTGKGLSELARDYSNMSADWLPEEDLPRGFFRWDPERFEKGYLGSWAEAGDKQDPCSHLPEKDPYYNPVNDPLRITNLDTEVLEPLKEAMDDGNVKIRHVALILMESLREELFPLQQGSDIYNLIMKPNEDDKEKQRVDAELARLTPHIERITGKSGNFKNASGSDYEKPELVWDDKTEDGFGGVNVQGAFTAATMSTKSWAVNNCGAWVMPVEKFDEADTDSYQPCIPQILELFNRGKDDDDGDAESEDFRDHTWYPAMFESQVEEYDRQQNFDKKLGFEYKITRKQIEDDDRFNESDVLYQKINYFAYPEPVLLPFLTDYINETLSNNKRMFFSHFTSTTHHAWDTPEDFDQVSYMPTSGMDKWHTDFNKYINTIRYHDAWMGQLMQLFDDMGISNETLVVFAGDHGQAFKEDYSKTGTYENGHVSNFRVPIVFRHPHLPRVQYEANATTISILPTILDLLVNSGSLNDEDARVASDIQQDYEGQSLIRPYKTNENGRRAWNFAVINSGAGLLAVTSADAPYRLTMPLNKVFEYTVSDLSTDPIELDPVKAWSPEEVTAAVKDAYGEDAEKWVSEAIPIANWWSVERQRLWRHNSVPKDE